MSLLAKVKSNSISTRSLRSSPGVLESNKLGSVDYAVEMDATDMVTATRAGEFSAETRVGDIWYYVINVRTKEAPTKLQSGWIAYIHKGETLLTVTPLGEPEPEPEPEPTTGLNADVHISVRDGRITQVAVDGETWVKTSE